MGHGSGHGSAHGSLPFDEDEDNFPTEEVSPVKPKKPSKRAAKTKRDDPKEGKEAPKEWIWRKFLTKDTKMAAYNVALVGMMVMLSCVTLSFAKVYTVGDSAGWALAVDYNTWASDKTFRVGDKLVFNYDSSHTVDLVSSTDYAACAVGNSIASYNTGTTTIALNTTGSHYFICGIMGHCTGGMS
ncbi:blue copper protein-like protein [Tanacetum coccineum]